MKVTLYLVGKETDEIDADGNKVLLVYASRLTMREAESIMERNPGTAVFKRKVFKGGVLQTSAKHIAVAERGNSNGYRRTQQSRRNPRLPS